MPVIILAMSENKSPDSLSDSLPDSLPNSLPNSLSDSFPERSGKPVEIYHMPGLTVFSDIVSGKIRLSSKGILKPVAVPVLKMMNGRFKEEKPALVTDSCIYPSAWLPPVPGPVFTRLMKAEIRCASGHFVPETVSFEVTRKHNPNCAPGPEPDADMIRHGIDQALEEGAVVITFTEGDPLLSTDIVDLVSYVDKSKAVVMCYTWGLDISPEKMKQLKEAGLQTLLVSLYSTDPSVHDRKRGIPGAFEKAVSAIRAGLDAGLLVTVATHIDKDKVPELAGLYEFAAGLGVHEFSVWESIPGPDGQARMDDDGRRTILEFYRRTNADPDPSRPRIFSNTFFEGEMFGYMAGRRWAHIDVDGNVHPDPYIPLTYGNITKEDLSVCLRRMQKEKIFRTKRKEHPNADPEYAARIRDFLKDNGRTE